MGPQRREPRGRHDEPGAAASSAAPPAPHPATPRPRVSPALLLQIKISQPLAAASWEATAAKIHIQGKSDVHFEDLAFSKSGRLLAALAGSSVFQHLCVYAVRAGGKKGSSLQPLGEVHPSPAIGAFKAFIWLPNDIVAVVTRQGCVWLLEHDVAGGGMAESQVRPARVANPTPGRAVRLTPHTSAPAHQVHLGLEGVGTAALASTGYIGIVSLTHLVMFNPLAGDAAASIALPALSSDPTKVEFEIAEGGGKALISLADGALVRLSLPELPELDLSAARVASEVFEERTDGGGTKGWSKPRLFFSMNAGATNGRRCAQSWSAGQGLLATITSSGMLVVLEHKEGAAEPKAVLSMQVPARPRTPPPHPPPSPPPRRFTLPQLPDSPPRRVPKHLADDPAAAAAFVDAQLPGPDVVFMEWDPAAGTQLAVAVRGAGVVLWKAGSEEKPTLWSGMTYAPVFKLAGSKKEFDPRFARWSRSAQLVVGMGDGSFAVYDSVSGAVFVSGRSGRHKAPITAGDWLSSLFAPALALASTSTVKVSEGFEKMEWEGTAMKLKINEGQDRPHFMPKSAAREKMDKAKEKMKDVTDEAMRTMRRKAKPDIEGTEFKDVAFSPSGKYLACLGAPTMEPTQLQVVVYELQDARSTLVAVREVATSEHHTPISMGWQADEVLVVFLQSLTGGAIATVSPRGPRDAAIVYGGRDGAAPGRLMEGVAAKSGLIAALFRSTQDSATQLVLLNYAQGAAARPLNVIEQLGVPSDASSVQVRPREDATGSHDVTLGFEDGAVKVWHCAPA